MIKRIRREAAKKVGKTMARNRCFFLPVGSQRHEAYLKRDETWHGNCLRNYTFNGGVDTVVIDSLTSLNLAPNFKILFSTQQSVQQRFKILYFPIPHNALFLPSKFCINNCCEMLLGDVHIPKSISQQQFMQNLRGQTECIMGNWKIEN